jgi:hypothetical protein
MGAARASARTAWERIRASNVAGNISAAGTPIWKMAGPWSSPGTFARELDDEDGVLASEPHENDQANLHKDIVVTSREPNAKQSRTHAHRHNEDHRQRQCPALV